MGADDQRTGLPIRDSTPVLLALIAGTGLWGYYLVAAIAAGVYWLAAIDAVLLVAAVWALTRVLARRRQSRGASG